MLRGELTGIRVLSWTLIALVAVPLSLCHSAEPTLTRELLAPEQWRRLENSVDAGLKFLVTRQKANGSFTTLDIGQPGITSLCVLAFLSRGHLPQRGEYGKTLDRAIEFVLQTQKDDGLLSGLPVNGREWHDKRHKSGAYNHPIAGVMLAEVYGMTQGETSDAIGRAISRAVKFSIAQQIRPKRIADEKGGWRYLIQTSPDADLSVTTWQIMFFRAAKNAGFEVPLENVDAAMDYLRRLYVPESGTFAYGANSLSGQQTRAMAGSGILLLSLGGEHDSKMARTTGAWILKHPFERYNQVVYPTEHYHYSAYYCSQAMFQLGGEYWEQFFPQFMRVHVDNQRADGSWSAESNRDTEYGDVYTTSLMILSLTPPFQLLPIYQR
jgi:hypothetical protein